MNHRPLTPASDEESNHGIAIIGMACLFPGARDLDAYWQNILDCVDAVTDPPAGSWDPAHHYDPDGSAPDQIYCKKGGFLAPLAEFDPLQYGIMPIGLDGGEPDQWLALKIAYDALTDAGYVERLRATPAERQRTAVILGKGTYLNRGNLNMVQHSLVVEQTIQILRSLDPTYSEDDLEAVRGELKRHLPPFNAESAPGLVPNITAGRIANRLDLMGPAYTVDAACASSLVAVEHAMRELASHQCDLALVGGVHVATPIPILSLFSHLGALSRGEQIRPFDKNADGTILSEGVGMVVLKRQQDAERDGDRVYAVVKGVGSASDGRGMGVLTPRLEGEVLALQRAYEMAGVEAQTVGLIEAHGTGTPVGDRTEIQALRTIFGERGDGLPSCALGSVKSMIGHTMPAAGIAGIIKSALSLYHKVLPPTIHVDEPHPGLELGTTPFYLNTAARPWIQGTTETPRRAGVNAFGFGGINAHVLLEEGKAATEGAENAALPQHRPAWESELVVVSASSRAELIEKMKSLLAYCNETETASLLDVAHTVTLSAPSAPDESGELAQSCRLALVAESLPYLCAKLERALTRLAKPKTRQIKDMRGIYYFEQPLYTEGKLAFLFPGEGAQYPHMLADLCLHFPAVRACFDRIDGAFADHPRGFRPSDFIFPRPALSAPDGQVTGQMSDQLWQIDGAIEAVLTANTGLFTLLNQLGIEADACVGHSTGEYSALLASGAIDVDDEHFMRYLLDLNQRYAEVQQETEVPRATMVAMGAGLEQIKPLLDGVESVDGVDGEIHVGMDNCPHQTIVLGAPASMEAVMAAAQEKGVICEILPFDRGYHSPLFAPYNHLFEALYRELPLAAPRMPIYSCVTAAEFGDDVEEIRRLATENWVSRVRFRETVEAMYADGVRLFVEVGPRGNLTAFVGDILRGQPHLAMASNIQQRSELTQLNHLLALLCAQHVPLNLAAYYRLRNPKRVTLDAEGEAAAQQKPVRKLATGWAGMRISPAVAQQLRGRIAHQTETPPQPHDSRAHDNGAHDSHTQVNGDFRAVTPLSKDSPRQKIKLEPLTMQTLHPTGNHPPAAAPSAAPSASTQPLSLAPSRGAASNGQVLAPAASANWSQQERAFIVQAHLQLMDQFLRTQETVMSLFLGGEASSPAGPRQNETPFFSALHGQPVDVATNGHAQAPPPPAPTSTQPYLPAVQATPAPTPAPVAPVPVAPDPTPAVPAPVAPAPVAPAAVSAPTAPPTSTPEQAQAVLLRLVSERTGYPTEMLDLSANLEADLGIDSIKRVEILGAFNQETSLLDPKDIDHVSSLRSLGAMLDFFQNGSSTK